MRLRTVQDEVTRWFVLSICADRQVQPLDISKIEVASNIEVRVWKLAFNLTVGLHVVFLHLTRSILRRAL